MCKVLVVIVQVLVEREGCLVSASPVVLEFAVTPLLLECGFTGILRGRVVEVPRLVVVHLVRGGGIRATLVATGVALGGLLGQVFLAGGILGLFLLFLLQVLNDFLDYLLLLLGSHLRESQQRVLEGHVLSVNREFVEHITAFLEFLVVGIVLVHLCDALGVAGLRQVIFVLGEVHAAQGELADGLVDAVAGALLGGELVVLDGIDRVVARQVQVAYCIVNLIQIILVAVIVGH